MIDRKIEWAFICFSGVNVDSLRLILEQKSIAHHLEKGRIWDYLILDEPELSHFFFIEYKREFQDDSKWQMHKNGVTTIQSITLEENASIISFLNTLTQFGLKQTDNYWSLTNGTQLILNTNSNSLEKIKHVKWK